MFKKELAQRIEEYLKREGMQTGNKPKFPLFLRGRKASVSADLMEEVHEGDVQTEEEDFAELFEDDEAVEDVGFEEEAYPVPKKTPSSQLTPTPAQVFSQKPPSFGDVPSSPCKPSVSNSHIQEKSLIVPSFLASAGELEQYIDDTLEETDFAKKLNQYMYEKDLTTAMIYRRCLVDRKLVSKISTQRNYHPSKSTVFALCIGLRLTLPEGEEFLSLAGYGFNRSSKYDLIIKFMLENRIYDLDTINEMLLHFKQPCFE